MIKVGVFGAGGRMGQTVCGAVNADTDLELVGGVDPEHVGETVEGITVAADADALTAAGAEVVIDFTHLMAARMNLEWAAAKGVHAVVGTSGFGPDDHERLRQQFTKSNCLVVSNFAIGAVLMMRFAELAAPFFETAEIIELHHDAKIDAPSGTAMTTAERMAAASSEWNADPTKTVIAEGARGGVGPGGIHVHAVRLHGLVAHQEVLLGTTGQMLTIRHDSYDRQSFMPGVVLAAKKVADLPGLTLGLDPVLGF
jgi:4-hydroxy-tetrahydrodipicolinate reductase